MNINGIWEGEYTYGADYPTAVIGTSVSFRVNLSTNGSDIEGTFTDEETLEIFPRGGILTGTYENTYISLWKRYPHSWGFTETGEQFFDETLQSQEVAYEGFFDGEKYAGHWVIPLIERSESGEFFYSETETLGSGTWWMRRVV
jgi:hypothetical protein